MNFKNARKFLLLVSITLTMACEDGVDLSMDETQTGITSLSSTNSSYTLASTTYTNPVLDVSGDPFCMKFNGKFYLYLPKQNGDGTGGKVICYTSTDLVHWVSEGIVYTNTSHAYGGQNTKGLWAPEVMHKDGTFYLYVVNVMSNPLDSRVGDKDIVVIEGTSPLNFNNATRKVLLDGKYAFIDPSPFKDPSNGKLYLYYKKRHEYGTGTQLNVRPMSDPKNFGGTSVKLFHSSDIPNAASVLEHPHCLHKKGKYFFFFSKNSGKHTDYAIDYALGNSPMGPFNHKGTLFKSDSDLTGDLSKKVISPGGSSIVRDGNNQAYMVYRQKTTTNTTFSDRVVCVDKVTIDVFNSRVTGSPSKGEQKTAPAPL